MVKRGYGSYPSSIRLPRRRRTGNSPYGLAAGVAAAVGRTIGRTLTDSKTKTTSRSISGTQNDVYTQYRKRRMPRLRRRRWVRFVRKTKSVINKALASRQMMFNQFSHVTNTFTGANWNDTNHTIHNTKFAGISLLSWSGSANYRDITQITKSMTDTNDLSTLTPRKLTIDTSRLDYTISFYANSSTSTNANEGYGDFTAEIDIYTIVFTRDDEEYAAPNNLISNAFMHNSELNAVNQVTPDTRGVTLFQAGQGLSDLGIKILSKKKVLLQGGQTYTASFTDKRNHTFNSKDVANDNLNNFRKNRLTKLVYFMWKYQGAVPSDTTSYNLGLRIANTRMYNVKELQLNNSLTRLLEG